MVVSSSSPKVDMLEFKQDSEAVPVKQDSSGGKNYGDAAYWEHRYRNDVVPFEWYQSYSGLRDVLKRYIHSTADILMLGCGNSVLSEDMVRDGFVEITNVDIFPTVVKTMKMKHLDMPQLKYVCADGRDMKAFKSGSFDAVVDKGTFDALMCGDSPSENVKKMLSEVGRVLRPGGVYFMVSYGEPNTRLPYVGASQHAWHTNVHLLARPTATTKYEGALWLKKLEPVAVTEDNTIAAPLCINDSDFHYVYACVKEKP